MESGTKTSAACIGMSFDVRPKGISCFRVALLLAIAFRGGETQGDNYAVLALGSLTGRIIGGVTSGAVNDVGGIAFPYTVSLRRRSDLGYFCTGVLIGNRHVLTAAHCVDSSITSGESRPQVVVGTPSSSATSGNGVQVISTQNLYIHPDYKANRSPDLAILELSGGANEAPVRIPTSADFHPKNGKLLFSLGWGRQGFRARNAETIQIAAVPFINLRRCEAKLGKPVFPHQICMGGHGPGSCPGDDGGPIVLPGNTRADDVLVGIVGSSHVCGKSTKPDVHTSVAPYIDWIKSNAGIP
ncbi:hypothetical protein BSKO_06730 [Bryopsis sp. KO-2023]|nr:hypothetical protein BSKO_06730 [Bryopsis sp. KO-2023]